MYSENTLGDDDMSTMISENKLRNDDMSTMIKWLRRQKKDSLVQIAYDIHIENQKLSSNLLANRFKLIDLLLEEEE